MDKDFGIAEPQDLQEIYFAHTRLEEAQALLENPPTFQRGELINSYMNVLLNIIIEAKAQEKRWWTMATKKYDLDGEITVDFYTGQFSLKKD